VVVEEEEEEEEENIEKGKKEDVDPAPCSPRARASL
jgi:hypothetical protein